MGGRHYIVDEGLPDAVHPAVIEDWSQALAERCAYTGAVRLELEQHPAVYAATFSEREHQVWFLDNYEVPAGIWQTPDRRTLVELSSFWGHPAVRCWSQVGDTLVQTMLRRTFRPPARSPVAQLEGLDEEMTRDNAPGRSIRVASGPADALLEAHRAHVAARGEARELDGCTDHVRLASQALAHSTAIVEARVRIGRRLQWASAVLLGCSGLTLGMLLSHPAIAVVLGAGGSLGPMISVVPFRLAHRWVAQRPIALVLR